jgi:carboxymethylenebutenolidase
MQTFESKGSTFKGYLAVPDSGSGPGVLVCHAWWGLNESFKAICEKLAVHGYVALAPDFYRGTVAKTIQQAEEAVDSLDWAAAAEIASAATDVLLGLPQVTSREIGAVACSLGGGFAIHAARTYKENVKAVVLLYAVGDDPFEETAAAYQGHFAENDQFDSPEVVEWLEGAIREAGRPVEFFTYPGTEHWFMEPDRPEYDPAADKLAWERILAFLEERLG